MFWYVTPPPQIGCMIISGVHVVVIGQDIGVHVVDVIVTGVQVDDVVVLVIDDEAVLEVELDVVVVLDVVLLDVVVLDIVLLDVVVVRVVVVEVLAVGVWINQPSPKPQGIEHIEHSQLWFHCILLS